MSEQRTPEWYAQRCGKITASRIGDLMATTRNGWAASRKNYFNELVAERLTGHVNIRQVASLDRRVELERDARVAYEFFFGGDVDEVGFIQHPTIGRAGASPDGLIGLDGGLEIKCCDSPAHLEMVESLIIDPKYLAQCQFGMACTERAWWDFLSYDPHMPEDLKAFCKRIERDDHAIERIEQAVRDFDAEIEAKIAMLRNGSRAISNLIPD